MGTSSSGGGAGGKNPLIPTWVGGGSIDENTPETDTGAGQENTGNDAPEQSNSEPSENSAQEPHNPQQQVPNGNRYRQPRADFSKYIRSGGSNKNALKKALRTYSRTAAGSTTGMARRMRPSAVRVASFLGAINTVREVGSAAALQRFSLTPYAGKPLSDILAALSEEIFKNENDAFANTQDDNITRNAYANTVVRICDLDGIDLDTLTNEHVETMTAIFIEETIVQRVLCDIGNKMTKIEHNIQKLVEIEENVYQFVNGMVRNKIMSEIKATQLGDKRQIEHKMENIYRIAFDAMAELI